MSGKGKIHEHPKASSNGFKQNPQNINRSGAPRKHKLVRELNSALKEDGVEPLTYADFEECYKLLLNCSISQLKEVADPKSDKFPILAARIALGLMSAKDTRSFEAFQDRAFHKAAEKHIVESKNIPVTEDELLAEINRIRSLIDVDVE